jgi:thioredoxin reductase
VEEFSSRDVDLVVIGAGPAGLAAAISAKKNGIQDLVLVERNGWLGGILTQCIHDGFGLELFKEQLTGPEYAQRYIDEVKKLSIPFMLNSMVLEVTPKKKLFVASPEGLFCFNAKAIILAMGCLPRNIQQCLIDYAIPLFLSHTVTEIHGQNRVESVTVSPVDENLKPIEGKEKRISCDTLLLSTGLIPENDLSKNCGVELSSVTGGAVVDDTLETSVQGIFACGNVLHVHDVVDFVTLEAERAGKSAAEYILGNSRKVKRISVEAGKEIRYVLPQSIRCGVDLELSIRVTCPREDVVIEFFDGGTLVKTEKLRKVHPAQMVKIRLKGSETSGINSLKAEVLGK